MMNKYDLTENQKEILRTILKADDDGSLHQKGFVLAIRGDDEYQIFGCALHLASLADLDALCDAGLLIKERGGSDPQYRITNSAKNAVANNFQALDPELQQIDQLIAKGENVISTLRPIPGLMGFTAPDPGAFNEWESQSINFLNTMLGQESTYFQQFQAQGDPGFPGSIDARLGILKAARQDLLQGNLRRRKVYDSSQDRSVEMIFQGPVTNSTFITGDGNTQMNIQNVFLPIYRAIEDASFPETTKADVKAEVQDVETEVRKGDTADEGFLARRLRILKLMAPDIAEVALSALCGPGAVVSMVVKKVAKKVKSEA